MFAQEKALMGTGGVFLNRVKRAPREKKEHRWPRIWKEGDRETPARFADSKWCGCRMPKQPCRQHGVSGQREG